MTDPMTDPIPFPSWGDPTWLGHVQRLQGQIDRLCGRVDELEARREVRIHPRVVERDRLILEFLGSQAFPVSPTTISVATGEPLDRVAERCRVLEKTGRIVRATEGRTPHYAVSSGQ